MSTEKSTASGILSGSKNIIAGGCGGICVVLSGHPFDTVKVRLQTMPVPGPGQAPLYAGAMDCVKKTVKAEGFFKGLYQRHGSSIGGCRSDFCPEFFGNDLGKTLIRGATGSSELNAFQLGLAGGFSGILTTAIMAPGERIKCILQVQQGGKGSAAAKYSGPVDVAKSLYREGGLRSIYKGTVATLLRDVPASAMYFGSYEIIQRALVPEGGDRSEISIGRTIFAGGMAGIFNWMVALPPDVVKSRLQSATDGSLGTRQVFVQVLKTEGVGGFFKGAVPVLARAFPANACCFMGYEAAMYAMKLMGI